MHAPSSIRLLAAAVVVLAPAPAAAQGIPISVLVDAAKVALTNSESVAATFAVAHTVIGTGGGAAGACYKKSGPSLFSTSASCHNSDFFPHPTPPPTGDDHADANASASSSLLGGGAASTSPTHISKGDFAAAGAFARSGFQISLNTALPAGAPAAAATFTLPLGSTITASTDPGDAFFGFMVTDQSFSALNGTLFNHAVNGLTFAPYLPASEQPNVATPPTVYWALLLDLNGATGHLGVMNFGTLVGTPITAADFTDLSTPGTFSFALAADHTITLDIPPESPGPSTQTLEFDAMAVDVAATPEPENLLLLGAGLVVLGAVVLWRRRRRNDA